MFNVQISVHNASDEPLSNHQFFGESDAVLTEIRRYAAPFTADDYKVYVSVSGGTTAEAATLTTSVLAVVNPPASE